MKMLVKKDDWEKKNKLDGEYFGYISFEAVLCDLFLMTMIPITT